jgi:hypothetical protein
VLVCVLTVIGGWASCCWLLHVALRSYNARVCLYSRVPASTVSTQWGGIAVYGSNTTLQAAVACSLAEMDVWSEGWLYFVAAGALSMLSLSSYQRVLTLEPTAASSMAHVLLRSVCCLGCAPGRSTVCSSLSLGWWLICLTNILCSLLCPILARWLRSALCRHPRSLWCGFRSCSNRTFCRQATRGAVCLPAVGVEYLCRYVVSAVGLYMYLHRTVKQSRVCVCSSVAAG